MREVFYYLVSWVGSFDWWFFPRSYEITYLELSSNFHVFIFLYLSPFTSFVYQKLSFFLENSIYIYLVLACRKLIISWNWRGAEFSTLLWWKRNLRSERHVKVSIATGKEHTRSYPGSTGPKSQPYPSGVCDKELFLSTSFSPLLSKCPFWNQNCWFRYSVAP